MCAHGINYPTKLDVTFHVTVSLPTSLEGKRCNLMVCYDHTIILKDISKRNSTITS